MEKAHMWMVLQALSCLNTFLLNCLFSIGVEYFCFQEAPDSTQSNAKCGPIWGSPFTTEASLQKKHVTQHWVHDKQIMVVSVISLWYNKIGWWNLEWTDKGQSAVGVGRHIREGPGVLPNFYACKRGCVAGSVRDGKCHSDESKVSWRAAEPWPRMERESWKTEEKREMQGKVQHNNKKKGGHSRNRERRNKEKEEQEEASLWWANI